MDFIPRRFSVALRERAPLYHGYAAGEPILDYHSQPAPADIALPRSFNNLFELWLEGDHYKWRAMRANGVEEAVLHRRCASS